MVQLGSLLLSPEQVVTLVVDAEASSRAASTHQWKLRLGNAILGSEVRSFESGVPGDLRDLVELEFGDLGGNEREEDEERCEVLHGGGRRKARAGRVQPSKPRWTPEALPRIDQKMNGRFGATEAG